MREYTSKMICNNLENRMQTDYIELGVIDWDERYINSQFLFSCYLTNAHSEQEVCRILPDTDKPYSSAVFFIGGSIDALCAVSDDIDNVLLNYIVKTSFRETGIDITPKGIQSLRGQIEELFKR
jgi:hypothetical protein